MSCLRALWMCLLLCACALGLPIAAHAQATPANVMMSKGTEHRVALIVGNAAYASSPLKNPVNDARAMRTKLKSLGFEVVYFENLQTKQVGAALREFRNLIKPGSVALFFYAGHGLQVRGENYLPSVDAELSSEEDVPYQSLSLSAVLNTMEDSKAAVNLVLLDACRNNPYARNFRSAAQGLARVQAPSGTLIHYATRPGSVAEDGKGTHGTYTEALLAQIDEKGVPIETALKRVTIRVREATKGKQEPWMEGSLTGDFYFIIQNAQITVQPEPITGDAAAWQAADSSGSVVAYQAYLNEYPTGLYAAAARIKLAAMQQVAAVPLAPPTTAPRTDTAGAAASLLAVPPPGTKDVEGFVWRDVQAKSSRAYYDAYLLQYPKGRYLAQARAALRRLDQRDAQQLTSEQQRWDAALRSRTEAGFQSYLQAYPTGRYAGQASASLAALQQPEPPVGTAQADAPQRPLPERSALPQAERDALRTAALRELSLSRISGADYQMGATAGETGDDGQPDAAALPQHNVKVGNFELAYYEVTVAQFKKFADATGYLTEAESSTQAGCQVPGKGGQWQQQSGASWRAPGYPQTDSHPVVCVSFNDVQAYLQWLNGNSGNGSGAPAVAAERYRLPSESEWEFAARGGTTTPRPWADEAGFFGRIWDRTKTLNTSDQTPSRACKYANIADESLRAQLDWQLTTNCKDGYAFAVPGGYFSRNYFSLYDMLGNAAEWTQDCWNASHNGAPRDARVRSSGDCTKRVVRGGSWASTPATIRSAARQAQGHAYRAADLGFRIARSPKE